MYLKELLGLVRVVAVDSRVVDKWIIMASMVYSKDYCKPQSRQSKWTSRQVYFYYLSLSLSLSFYSNKNTHAADNAQKIGDPNFMLKRDIYSLLSLAFL